MLTFAQRRERLRAQLNGTQLVVPACVFDPISIRLAEQIGFEVALLPGSLVSAVVLGAPDDVLITLSELVEHVRRICRASDVPLIVDADHGYGNARNVARTVEELEAAGAAALLLEDTVLPAPFGATAPQVISLDEGVAKIRAAVAARVDPSLVIVARSIALAVEGIDGMIARARAYQAAGADGMFLGRLRTRAELDALAAATTLPFFAGKPTPELSDPAFLAARRVRFAVPGHETFLAAVRATEATLRAQHAGTSLGDHAPDDLLERVLR
jgi:carboxyvinyl-carboxyphosphonate phosphorylmutase